MSVTMKRTANAAVTTAEVNGVTYYVTRMSPKSYGVATGNRVVDVVETAKAAREVIAADAGAESKAPASKVKSAPVEKSGPSAEQKARTKWVRAWATATGRHSGTRGRLPAELFAEFDARPAGPWRTKANKFVKTPKDAPKVAPKAKAEKSTAE